MKEGEKGGRVEENNDKYEVIFMCSYYSINCVFVWLSLYLYHVAKI